MKRRYHIAQVNIGRTHAPIDDPPMAGFDARLDETNALAENGEEVFAVLDGTVAMHYREDVAEKMTILRAGDIFFASIGCEHVARPQGVARILVVEKEDSV
jgi:mannose-6-phosphate isomerase-like protein (cupin superfamily)